MATGKRSLRQWIVIPLALAALVLVLAWMAGAFIPKVAPDEQVQPPRRPLPEGKGTAPIHEVTQQVVETVIGTLVAERQTTVAPKILATIDSIHVSAGSRVEQGDLLIDLDARDQRAALEQAEQALAATRATLNRARTEYRRMTDLLEQNVVSQREFDDAEEALRVAEAELSRSERAAEQARVRLSYARIEAPISGQVVDRLAEPGDTASPGMPILTLYDPQALRLEAPVREALATRLEIGQPLTVHIEALDLKLQGRVDEIVPQAERMSRSFLVKVGVPPHEGIYSGMFGRLDIPAGQRNRICLPQAALERIGQLLYIYVKQPDGFERRFVQVGEHSRDGNVELLSGALPGEEVLLLHEPQADPAEQEG